MYDLSFYGKMATDEVRGPAYTEALKHAVKPGSTVVEIGTGPGFFAVMAVKLGAKRVYAIEPDRSIEVGRQLAELNGVADRITFIQDMSTKVKLPERADILLSDLRGVMPYLSPNIASVIDARERFLQPGGQIIAQRDAIWATALEAPATYAQYIDPWNRQIESIDLTPGLRYITNTWNKANISVDQFLGEPACIAAIDYYSVRDDSLDGELELTVSRDGFMHAVGVWFDSELTDDIGFSNHPSQPRLVYGRAFFPLTAPLEVAKGDLVKVRLRANMVNGEYIWRWDTDLLADDSRSRASFRQSSLYSHPVSASHLARRANNFTPQLNDSGRLAIFMLSLMSNDLTTEEIACRARKEFPTALSSVNEYLSCARELVLRYGA
jgi:protein arginine N-methyltransferase 1